MAPAQEDLIIAREWAQAIADMGCGRVRRVLMIGSRARGTARPDSDTDLVVMVELPANTSPWKSRECSVERDRIRGKLPTSAAKLELTVRTSDQFAEARDVVGSMEWLAATEGVEVYRRPLLRKPIIRRSATQVRHEYAAGWLAHGLHALGAAIAFETSAIIKAGRAPLGAQHAASAAVMRGITALLVHNGVWASKHDGMDGILRRLAEADPISAAEIQARLCSPSVSARAAHAVLVNVVQVLANDREILPRLRSAHQRLSQPVLFLD